MPRRKNPDTVAKNTAYKNAYNQQHYERFSLTVPKGAKSVLLKAAQAQNKSLNAYIIQTIERAEGLDLSGDKKL